ncbi:MAG: hypothetical protein ABSE58_04305 [Candidatus Limnocylindrales bacterium]
MASGMKWLGLLMVSASMAAGCAVVPEPSASQGEGANGADSPCPAVSASSCGGGDLSVDRSPYVIAGMQVPGFFPDMGQPGWQTDDVALRDVVVVGKVIAKDAGFFAQARDVFTPFTVDIDRVIRGEARVGHTSVAIEGGTVGCYTLHVDVAPALEPGTRYVFFLSDGVGGQLAPGNVFDAWPIDADNVVRTLQGPMPLGALVDRIDRLSAVRSSPTPAPTS